MDGERAKLVNEEALFYPKIKGARQLGGLSAGLSRTSFLRLKVHRY
jgi:hypothetical protein